MSDLQDLVRSERFGEIHEARRTVIEDERQLNKAMSSGAISEAEARRYLFRSVRNFVRELETLLDPVDGDAKEHWTDTKIGMIRLPDESRVTVKGLGQFLNIPENISVDVEVEKADRYFEMPSKRKESRVIQPPMELSQSAFRWANQALSEMGLELNPDDVSSSMWEFREIKDVDDINPEDWKNIKLGNGGD